MKLKVESKGASLAEFGADCNVPFELMGYLLRYNQAKSYTILVQFLGVFNKSKKLE
jgi:hypothetical protein